MRPLALIACTLLLAAGTARADLVLGGATDAGQPDAGDVPVQLAAGQPAPGPGWWLSDQQAAAIVHESKARAEVLQHPPEVDGGAGLSGTEAVVIGAATFAAGVAAGVYLHQRATH